ncbi:hypothetical protein [Paenibacillus sp. L3-i20]|uniref:hypothetical protein n=1 Tax=Paenibacillus sp. L3-i20 TaxID=2905833 RepID=UPI001EE0E2D1|nr:hypothetical protein [Paenibacillus sp. L3-i20]GKU75962.1 hypothetical protein L3i20_v203590 [Paenibacillus sp. L3-i20]
MTDITGSTLYEYKGSTGELLKTTYPDQKSINYTYNSLGLRDSMTDPFSYATTYTYDNRNRLTGVGASATDQEVSYTYYTNNLMKNITLKNGNKTLMNYKGLRLQNMSHQKNDGSLLHSFQYGYDGNGNIINSSGSQANVAINKSYTYDPLSRIATSSEFNESYLYDNRDNRATLSTEQPINNAMFSDKSYTYDSQNRLTKAVVDGKEVTYRYNGDGLLYERTEAGVTTRYYYDGPNIIAEGTVDSNGNATFKARYVRGHQLAARQDAAGQAYYLHNGHGDVIELRGSSGNNALNTYTYDLWGKPLTATGTIANPFLYSGEMWDSTSKLQYLRARWYDGTDPEM